MDGAAKFLILQVCCIAIPSGLAEISLTPLYALSLSPLDGLINDLNIENSEENMEESFTIFEKGETSEQAIKI